MKKTVILPGTFCCEDEKDINKFFPRVLISRRKVLGLFLLFFIVMLSACTKSEPAANLDINQPAEVESRELAGPELEKHYESSLKEILRPFWEINEITGLKDEILALKTPAKYLDLHLKIVIAFEFIEQGRANSDPDKVEQGLEKVAKLEIQYPWIRDAE